MTETMQQLFDALKDVRYVAIYRNGQLDTAVRPELQDASSSESDKYEEIIVNPTLLKLVQQRGNIDCGGVQYVLVRYGSFFQFVQAIPGGHISIALEAASNLDQVIPKVRQLLRESEGV